MPFTDKDKVSMNELSTEVKSRLGTPLEYELGSVPNATNGNVDLSLTDVTGESQDYHITGTGMTTVTSDANGDIQVNTSLPATGVVTGVKGDKEATYRDNNVNITPGNIGALPDTTTYAGSSTVGGVATEAAKTTGKLTFTGASSAEFDGSENASVNIPKLYAGTGDATDGAMTQKAVTDIIAGLDANITGTPGAGKTLTALDEVDGVLSATFADIAISKAQAGLGNVDNKSSETIRSEITSANVTTALGFTPADAALIGSNGGIATLDSSGHIPSSQMPGSYDEVQYYASMSAFPTTGTDEVIYVAKDTNLQYRWGGQSYVAVGSHLALGETAQTAYRGDRGATAYAHATETTAGATASGLYKISVTSGGHVATATAVTKKDITDLGIPGSVPTYTASDGVDLTGTNFTNSGVRSITTGRSGDANGTIAVNTGGTVTAIAVKGLASAAYTEASAYATSTQGGKADTAVQSVKISGSSTEYKSGTTVTLPAYPTTLPASDVSAWAKAASKPTYTASEVGAATSAQGGKADTAVQSVKITSSGSELKNGTSVVLPAYPTTLPASDVYSWAKAKTKPTYTAAEVGAAASGHTHTAADVGAATSAQGTKADTAVQSVKISGSSTEYKSGTTVTLPAYPTSLPASDVSSWAKAASKPSYTAAEVGAATSAQGGKADTAVQSVKITSSGSELKNGTSVVLPAYPTSLPASDVYAWAKASTKPSYTAAEVGAATSGHNHDTVYTHKFHYGGTGNTTKIKIKINSTAAWMLSFVVTLYQGYRATSVLVSGYQYGTQHWYSPSAVVLGDSGNAAINVYFGYDSTNNLWVGFDGGQYTGISIGNVTNGYTQIDNFAGLFTISNVSSLTTLQTTITAQPPSLKGHTHTKSQITDFPSSMPASDVYAWAKASTKPSYTASEVGAAPTSHTHTVSQITDLPAISDSATNSSLVKRTANGHIFATYLNQSSGAETPSTSSYIIYANSDGYLRKSSLANVKSILGLKSAAYTESSAYATASHTHSGYAAASHDHHSTAYGTQALRHLASGTAAATTSNCPSGAWYGYHS